LRKWGARRFVGRRRLDISLFMRLDLLLHLYLLMVSLLLVQFGTQAGQLLSVFRCFVAFTRRLLASSFLVVQSSSMEFPPSFHVLILRLQNSLACAYTKRTVRPTMVGDQRSKSLEVWLFDNLLINDEDFQKFLCARPFTLVSLVIQKVFTNELDNLTSAAIVQVQRCRASQC